MQASTPSVLIGATVFLVVVGVVVVIDAVRREKLSWRDSIAIYAVALPGVWLGTFGSLTGRQILLIPASALVVASYAYRIWLDARNRRQAVEPDSDQAARR